MIVTLDILVVVLYNMQSFHLQMAVWFLIELFITVFSSHAGFTLLSGNQELEKNFKCNPKMHSLPNKDFLFCKLHN